VVFGRCTPREKEKIVSCMKGRVLAIGDGANDVSMLTKASVGVGIAGKEGRAAVQAADFGIP
jgi:P-type E1-E2 ATPase